MIIKFGHPKLTNNEFLAVKKVLKSGILVHGKQTSIFEAKFKKFTNSKYSVAVSSCTAGLHLYYFQLGLKRNDEVIIPAMTHTATAHAIELVGAKPVFVDCKIETGNIDPDLIEKKINNNTKAICVVHFLGIPAEMKKIIKIAKKYNLKLIEDCALSVGAKINDVHVGNFGDAGVFSFYPVKHICTGEGGMVISNKKTVFEKIKLKRAFGINKNFSERKTAGFYDAIDLGFNYRMSEIESALGIQQLKKVNSFLNERKKNFNNLKEIIKCNNISILDLKNKNYTNSHYCLTIILPKNKRENIIPRLKDKKIGFSIYYPQPVPRMSYYKKKYGYNQKHYPNSENISDNSIAFPIGPHMNDNKILFLGENLNKILKQEI